MTTHVRTSFETNLNDCIPIAEVGRQSKSNFLTWFAVFAIFAQNPFALGLILGEWYKFLYFLGIASYLTHILSERQNFKYFTGFGLLYLYFILATIVCVLVNAATIPEINLVPTAQYLIRLFQFFFVMDLVLIIGVLRFLSYMYRLAVTLGALALLYMTLNYFDQQNPFFDIPINIDENINIYYSFPFGFTEFLIPVGERLRVQSYFTEPANFAYFQAIFLLFGLYRIRLVDTAANRIGLLIIFGSILATQSVAGVFTLLFIGAYVSFKRALDGRTIGVFLFSVSGVLIFLSIIISMIEYLGSVQDSVLYYVWISLTMRPLEWLASFDEIIRVPFGLGFGNLSDSNIFLETDSIQNFSKEYMAPTNILLPIYSLGLLYILPFGALILNLFYQCLRIPRDSKDDLRMASAMMLCGLIFSGSYFQINTAIFQMTLAVFVIFSAQGRRFNST